MGRDQPGGSRSVLAAMAALGAAVALAVALAGPAGAKTGPGLAVRASSPAEAEATSDYWTPERMASAQPAELTVTGSGSGSAPAASSGGGAQYLNHPIAFTRTHLTDTRSYPNRVHGRVFFTKGMGNFACSGTVVSSHRRNAVLTAGHCVFDASGGTGFVRNWQFVPSYEDPDGPGGNPALTPFGTFPATTLLAPTEWTSSGAVNSDLGGALVGPNGDGSRLESLVGARGIAFNQPRNQAYHAFGYPLEAPFDGTKLYRCDSRYGGDGPSEGSGGSPMAIGCDFTGGSSGGGWVAKNEVVTSVVSFRLASHPEVIYGPHLEAAARSLYGRGLGGFSCRGLIPTIVGTSAGERILGTPRKDVVFAHGGADTVKTGAGNDVVCGGGGADSIQGGRGRDRLFGGAGSDKLSGGKGRRDRCVGGGGNDAIRPSCEL